MYFSYSLFRLYFNKKCNFMKKYKQKNNNGVEDFAEFHKKCSSTQKLPTLTRSHDPAHNSSHDSTHNVTFNHNLLKIPYVCVLFKSGQ